MLSFFKSKGKKPKKQGLDSTIESNEIMKEEKQPQDELIQTALSFHPGWTVSEEDRYVYQFLNNECQPLKPNQLSLSGLELQHEPETGSLVATAFVRSSLKRSIQLEKMNLLLLGPEQEVLAKKQFDLGELGELPAASSRPWRFVFEPPFVKNDSLPESGWTLAFQLKPSHKLDLEKSWVEILSKEEQDKLQDLVEKKLPSPAEGEVNFMGLQARHTEEGSLQISVLIRNGSEQNVTFDRLPLSVEDASGELVATGNFQLNGFTVKAYTTKPWTFTFPKELVQKEKPDFSSWKVYVKQ